MKYDLITTVVPNVFEPVRTLRGRLNDSSDSIHIWENLCEHHFSCIEKKFICQQLNNPPETSLIILPTKYTVKRAVITVAGIADRHEISKATINNWQLKFKNGDVFYSDKG